MREVTEKGTMLSSTETTLQEIDCSALRSINITLDNVGANALDGLTLETRPTEKAPYTPLAVDDDFNTASMFILFSSADLHQLASGKPGSLILNVEQFQSIKLVATSAAGTEADLYAVCHA